YGIQAGNYLEEECAEFAAWLVRAGHFHFERFAFAVEIDAPDLAGAAFGRRPPESDRARAGKTQTKDEIIQRAVATPVGLEKTIKIGVRVDPCVSTYNQGPAIPRSRVGKPGSVSVMQDAVIEGREMM